jgi:hypothetical protein
MVIEVAPDDKEWVGFEVRDLDPGETISEAVWTLPDELTKLDEALEDRRAGIKLEGYVLGQSYRVFCRMVTSIKGREINRYFDIVVNKKTGNRFAN